MTDVLVIRGQKLYVGIIYYPQEQRSMFYGRYKKKFELVCTTIVMNG